MAIYNHIVVPGLAKGLDFYTLGSQLHNSSHTHTTVNSLWSIALIYTVKPPIEDTLKEDRPPNKGKAESTLDSIHNL